jgi:ATP-dependent RNA helicase DDX46/PRP5
MAGFNEKVKAGKEKASFSGFGGKGLERLDQERDLARRRERKQFGEEGGEDVEEAEVADEAAIKPAVTPKAASAGPALDDEIVVHRRGVTDALDRVKKAVAAVDSRLKKNGELRSGVPIDNKGPDAGAYHATLEINDFPRASPIRAAIARWMLIASQRKLGGPSQTAPTSPRFWSKPGHLSPQKEVTILQERCRSLDKIRSCISWWKATRNLLLQTL